MSKSPGDERRSTRRHSDASEQSIPHLAKGTRDGIAPMMPDDCEEPDGHDHDEHVLDGDHEHVDLSGDDASIDAHMLELDQMYSGYGLASHKGYPTPEHCQALKSLGALPIHRRSFARVREALGLDPVQTDLFPAAPVEEYFAVEESFVAAAAESFIPAESFAVEESL